MRLTWALLPLLCACAARMDGGGADIITPGVEEDVIQVTAPAQSVHVIFDWSMREGEARFSGRGSARVAPGYRARLDLFGPRGEGYLSAVLVQDRLTTRPPMENAPLPPPSFLWSSLGVVTAPKGATLVSSTRDSVRSQLVYASGDERWRYVVENGKLRLVEHDRPGAGRETVEIRLGGPGGGPAQAVYRDWAAFRELILTPTEVRNVEEFPPDTWTMGGA